MFIFWKSQNRQQTTIVLRYETSAEYIYNFFAEMKTLIFYVDLRITFAAWGVQALYFVSGSFFVSRLFYLSRIR